MMTDCFKKALNFIVENPQVLVLGLLGWVATSVVSMLLGSALGVNGQPLRNAVQPAKLLPAMPDVAGMLLVSAIGFLISTYFIAAIYRFFRSRDILAALSEAADSYVDLLFGRVLQYLALLLVYAMLMALGVGVVVVLGMQPVSKITAAQVKDATASESVVAALAGFVASVMVLVVLSVIAAGAVFLVQFKLVFMDLMIVLGGRSPGDALEASWEHTGRAYFGIAYTFTAYGVLIGLPLFFLSVVLSFFGVAGSMLSQALSALVAPSYQVLVLAAYLHVKDIKRVAKAETLSQTASKIAGGEEEWGYLFKRRKPGGGVLDASGSAK